MQSAQIILFKKEIPCSIKGTFLLSNSSHLLNFCMKSSVEISNSDINLSK